MSVGGDYGKLFHQIWNDPGFIALPSRPQRLFMMLCSYHTRNYAGVVPMTVGRWARTAADLTAGMVREARYVVTDEDTEEVLVRSYMRWDGLWKQPNMIGKLTDACLETSSDVIRAEIVRELARIIPEVDSLSAKPESRRAIRRSLTGAAQKLWEGFPEGLGEGFPEGFLERFPEPINRTLHRRDGSTTGT
jgi:hypothetical protein